MKPPRFNARMILLLLTEAMLLFGGLIVAVYVHLGAVDAEDALIERNGFYKAAPSPSPERRQQAPPGNEKRPPTCRKRRPR